MSSSVAVHPCQWWRETDIALRDGSTLRVRTARPDDAVLVREFIETLSDRARYMRFLGARRLQERDVAALVEVDYPRELVLVGEVADAAGAPRLVAMASYVVTRPGVAEFAIAVSDDKQGRGIGTLLIEDLCFAARRGGVGTFEADIFGSNRAMLEVLAALDRQVAQQISDGVVHVEFDTAMTEGAMTRLEERDAEASVAAVASFLEARSIAVIGASRRRGSIGAEIFRNLIEMDFTGPVYPVNPSASVVQSVAAFPSVKDIPGPVDMAVIVVPASAVQQVAEECAEKDVRALLVISAGFAEVGEEGHARQDALLELARKHGMRMIGPNCMGVMNVTPDFRMNATFSPIAPASGRLAFSSQSGALGIAIMDRARSLGLGMSSFVSVGNKADISGNDLLRYWEQDDNTDVILLYLESFGNPRKFARIARRIGRSKPIVAVKSGRSEAGARAAASHTASLAGGDVAVDALFRQAGVLRTDTLEELFDVAALLAHQPLPTGERVGILTNAGGLGILCADACEAAGLKVPPLADETRAALRAFLPAEASVGNPVDMIASASARDYARAFETLAADPEIDSVIVIFIPPLVTKAEDVADALLTAASDAKGTTVLSCFLGVHGIHGRLKKEDCVIPSYAFPESAARALARVERYARWRDVPLSAPPELADTDKAGAATVVAAQLVDGEGWLDPARVDAVLDAYSIPHARSVTVSDPDAVADAAGAIGGPVVVKIVSSSLVHKSDVGGVELDLATPDAARDAARRMISRLEETGQRDRLDGFLVQEMVTGGGVEMFVGMTLDRSFGPLVACGAGGTLVELMKDVSVRITPVAEDDAWEMLRSLRTYPLFTGYRGSPELDAPALVDLLLRIGKLVDDIPEIAELDLNPVVVFAKDGGCKVVDARIRVAPADVPKPPGAR